MKSFTKAEVVISKPVIDPDLADAKQLIKIDLFKGSKQEELAAQFQAKFNELSKFYPNINLEAKLFLLALTLNLLLYAFQRNISGQLNFIYKIKNYYKDLLEPSSVANGDKPPLTYIQKARWCAELARVHGIVNDYLCARDYYQQAIAYVKMVIKTNKNKLQHQSFLLELNVSLIEISLKRGRYHETEAPAPDIASETYLKVIQEVENALHLNPSKKLAIQLYLFKVEALDSLASLKHKKEPHQAFNFWIRAIRANLKVLSQTNVLSDTQKQCLNKMQFIGNQLYKLVTTSTEKDNFSSIVVIVKKINSCLLNFNLEKIDELEKLIDATSRSKISKNKSALFYFGSRQDQSSLPQSIYAEFFTKIK